MHTYLTPAHNRARGFTLVEVLVSLFILGILGAMGYLSYTVVSRLNETSAYRSMAINLAQRTFERVRAEAQVNFDTLNTASMQSIFTTDPREQDIAKEFVGFARTIAISPVENSSEIKRADVEIDWNERGAQPSGRSYQSVLFISRPSAPLPGNIHGKVTYSVTDAKTGAVTEKAVANASITVTYSTNSTLLVTTQTDSNGAYTFMDPTTKIFSLKPGDWKLTATSDQFYDYTHPVPISVGSNQDVEVDFDLTPKPTPAHIIGSVVDNATKKVLAQNVSFYEKGTYLENNNASGSFDFEVTFDTPDQRCFTLVTSDNGDAFTYYPYVANKHCGNFPDCDGWGKIYNYRGWSSAVVQSDGSIKCGNPWVGSTVTDRICVNPGDRKNISIPLVPVPTTTMSGTVYDSQKKTVAGATVSTYWHNDVTSDYFWASVQTDKSGHYQITVPAEQELFPDDSKNKTYYLNAQAQADISITACCNRSSTVTVYSPVSRVGPLKLGTPKGADFYLNAATNQQCGNAKGKVVDAKSASALAGASVTIATSTNTDGMGSYIFTCPQSSSSYYSIPAGAYSVDAQKSNFYDFSSDGNEWYSSRGQIAISANTVATYKDIRLLTIGKGDIQGTVLEKGSNVPVAKATVQLNTYWDSYDLTTTTDSKGNFKFTGALESWPPPVLQGDRYFIQSVHTHSIVVPDTTQYLGTEKDQVTLNDGASINVGVLYVTRKGGM